MEGKTPAQPAASFRLTTPRKRLFFVIGALGLGTFILGMLLAASFRDPDSDTQYALAGIGEWCMMVGFFALIAGALGSVLYDFTVRPVQLGVERLTEWIKAGS